MSPNPIKKQKPEKSEASNEGAFKLRKEYKSTKDSETRIHLLRPGIICDTEPRGYPTPRGRSPFEIVVDASEGFIPLWAKDMILRWRFRERSMTDFLNLELAKGEIRKLFGEALLAWGTAAPIKFSENDDLWDFEIVIRPGDSCNNSGCVLASAFFPDSGRHELVVYPKMFKQSREEQVDTFIHEIGHVFGLRHFFAELSETSWPVEIFGTHSKFSIMNYGELSKLTIEDKEDLSRLYHLAWSGSLTHINETPIRFVKPYHTLASEDTLSIAQLETSLIKRNKAALLLQQEILGSPSSDLPNETSVQST